MPAVVDNVRDVRGAAAADNVSLISNDGIWQFCPSHSDRPSGCLADLPGDSQADPGPETAGPEPGPLRCPPAGRGRGQARGPLPAWPWDPGPGGQPEAALPRLPAAARRAARVTRCQCIAGASSGGTARAND
jgi:hypothetical protein